MGALYLITGPTGKKYIGITLRDVESRAHDHKTWGVRRGSSYLHVAMRKYGFDAFSVSVLAHSDDWSQLCDMERKAIVEHGCKAPKGYNATDGGDGVPNLDPVSRAKHRANTSAGTTAAWAAGKMDGRAATFSDPAFKARHRAATSDAVQRLYADPEFRAKTVAALTSDAKRESNRVAAKAQWADPEKRAKLLQMNSAPEVCAARSEKMKAIWALRKAQKE
jgi:hypothetical protein